MNRTKIHFEAHGPCAREFRTAVSLHGHTLHSQEGLGFINRLSKHVAPLRIVMRRGEAKYEQVHGSTLDLARGWWTPPAGPQDALLLEKRQIENRLGLQAIVSLSDHDNIEAPLSLRVLEENRSVPVSVEWTVPYGPTFFHLCIHNLPLEHGRVRMTELAALTAAGTEEELPALLESLESDPEALIVFNHPCWDERGVGHELHMELALQFGRTYGQWLHALELNGLRPWQENRSVLSLAEQLRKPVISGGDRHALEPNTVLDFTNATTFSEYAAQVRSGYSDVLVTDQYREPFAWRILQSLHQIMQDHEGHGRGWVRWSDRVFYRCDDGVVRSMTTLFSNRVPGAVQCFVKGVGLLQHESIRQAFRFAFTRRQEIAL